MKVTLADHGRWSKHVPVTVSGTGSGPWKRPGSGTGLGTISPLGNNVEEAYGTGGYLLLYFVAGFGATAAFVIANMNATVPMIGASGAIAGVLGAYLVLFPTHRVLTLFLFFFVQIPAGAYLAFWFLLQFAVQEPGVAWEAHVGGFIVGVLITLPLRSVLLARVRRLHQPVRRVVGFR